MRTLSGFAPEISHNKDCKWQESENSMAREKRVKQSSLSLAAHQSSAGSVAVVARIGG